MNDPDQTQDFKALNSTQAFSETPFKYLRPPLFEQSGIARNVDSIIPLTDDRFRALTLHQEWFHRIYRDIEHIGTGGSGIILKATTNFGDRNVALKLLHTKDPDAIEGFLDEMRLLITLGDADTNDSILRFYNFGETSYAITKSDGTCEDFDHFLYAELELNTGTTLKELTQELHNINFEDHSELFLQRVDQILDTTILEVCRSLCFVHRQGIVHRDITPANIFAGGKRTRIADFGLAARMKREELDSHLAERLAPHSLITNPSIGQRGRRKAVGTIGYVSPEQRLGGKPVDARADIYSLGAVIYNILTGHPPIVGTTFAECLQKMEEHAFPTPKELVPCIPVMLNEIVMKALDRDPFERFQSMGEFERALESYLQRKQYPKRG